LSLQRQRFAGVDLPRQFAIAGRQPDVNTHLTQPTTWASLESRRGPREHLEQLLADKREAKAQLREVLEGLAEKHGISQKDVSYAIDGYADDMISDLVYGLERDLEHACE
jgi:hypothetical protein